MEIINILELLAKQPNEFHQFAAFNGHQFGTCDITGNNPGWEMHPDTDEFFYIIEGEAEMTLLYDDGPQHVVAGAGSSFVVPMGIWHKPEAPAGAKFLFFTPGESLTSMAEDPRTDGQ